MVNCPAAGGDCVVAVSVRLAVVPSGRLSLTVSVSPSLGWPPLKSTERLAGVPDGPLTAALLRFDETEASLNPNGETESSATETEVAVGALRVRRPSPFAPRSA